MIRIVKNQYSRLKTDAVLAPVCPVLALVPGELYIIVVITNMYIHYTVWHPNKSRPCESGRSVRSNDSADMPGSRCTLLLLNDVQIFQSRAGIKEHNPIIFGEKHTRAELAICRE